jgi:hypothetical protein
MKGKKEREVVSVMGGFVKGGDLCSGVVDQPASQPSPAQHS